MAITLTTDMILGIGALIVAAVAIIMFMRATEGTKKPPVDEPTPQPIGVEVKPNRVNVPTIPIITQRTQVEMAKTQIRTLTLQQEILSMVMKRLFEAEDNGEISKPEREGLSKNYESEMQQVNEQLNKAELIVSLNELEEIRTNFKCIVVECVGIPQHISDTRQHAFPHPPIGQINGWKQLRLPCCRIIRRVLPHFPFFHDPPKRPVLFAPHDLTYIGKLFLQNNLIVRIWHNKTLR